MNKIVKKGLFLILCVCCLSLYVFRFNKQVQEKQLNEDESITNKVNRNVDEMEEVNDVKEEYIEEKEIIQQESIQDKYVSRLTSYYTDDKCNTGVVTASGLSIYDFNVNNNGWYTYEDKLVIATASTRLGSTEMKTYNLYDELILEINGIRYDGIVLDVCGACMWDNRIDLFVSGKESVIDTNIQIIY